MIWNISEPFWNISEPAILAIAPSLNQQFYFTQQGKYYKHQKSNLFNNNIKILIMKNSIQFVICLFSFFICITMSTVAFSQTNSSMVYETSSSTINKDNTSSTSTTDRPSATKENKAANLAAYAATIHSIKQTLAKNISYTELALDYRIEGEVDVRLEVDENGKIKDSQIVKGLGMGLDEEVLRAIHEMPDGDFVKLHNIQANTVYTLSISFRLPK